MKAFSDVSAEDGKCMARTQRAHLNATSRASYAPMPLNLFDGSCAPALTGTVCELSKFMELLSPCFLAISNVEDVLLRVADSKGLDTLAKVIHYGDGVKDLFSPDAKARFGSCKNGQEWKRPHGDVQWPLSFVSSINDREQAEKVHAGCVTRVSHNALILSWQLRSSHS
eukprot:1030366-Amphidinium_carterae.3